MKTEGIDVGLFLDHLPNYVLYVCRFYPGMPGPHDHFRRVGCTWSDRHTDWDAVFQNWRRELRTEGAHCSSWRGHLHPAGY